MTNPEKINDDMLEKVVGGILTPDQALTRALEDARVTNPDFVKPVQLDYEHGRQVYEIKFYKDRFEYEYDIDAENGAVLKFEKDYD